jgi:site-specific DNA-methyltransferase (adenine-specific)
LIVAKYYEDESITLYHGDCRQIAEWTTADVLVTDPPYGIAWTQPELVHAGRKFSERSRAHAGIKNDHDLTARDAALDLFGDRPALVFGEITKPFPANTKRVLVWKKPNDAGLMGQTIWRKDWEPVFMVGKWPQIPATESSVFTSRGTIRDYGVAEHPHAKPVGLMETLISRCPPGVIADPFAGSGSTLIAARNLGRKAIGVELDERYCELIVKRLAQQAFIFEEAHG